MGSILYGLNSLLVSGVLLVTMAVAIEAGYRIGRARQGVTDDATRTHVNAIQASLLGILALLLGFSFSLALQRFEKRSEAVVDEANAIGTTYLRSHLLPVSVRGEAQELLRGYIDLRVQAGVITLDHEADRQELLGKTNQVLDAVWGCAQQAAIDDKSPVTTGLFIQALNEAIDSYGRRDAELSRRVPEVIWLLLYVTFLLTSGVIGYSAAIAGHRPTQVTYILTGLVVVLAFIVVDLDRPRRGLIKVDQSSITDLKAAIDLAQTAGTRSAPPANVPRRAVTGHR